MPAERESVEAVEPILLRELGSGDEVEGLRHALEVLAGDAERWHAAESGAEEDRVELLE